MVNGFSPYPFTIYHSPFTSFLLVLVDVDVLGVDDVVVAARRRAAAAGRARGRARRVGLLLAAAARGRLRAAALVERLGQLVRGGLEVVEGVVEPFGPALFERLLGVG